MAVSSISRALLASVIAISGVGFSAPSAEAQVQLHELLFNRKKRQEVRQQRQQRVQPRQSAPSRPQVVKVPKANSQKKRAPIQQISGPGYYTYKAPAMRTVALSAIVSAIKPADPLEAPVTDFEAQRFVESMATLGDRQLSIEPDIIDAMKAHYEEHPAFLWSRGTGLTEDAKAVVSKLAAAGDHGLDPQDYAVSMPPETWSMDKPQDRARALAVFELELTAHAVRYAMDMKDGFVEPNKLSGYHDFSRKRMSAEEALRKISMTGEGAKWLERMEPQQPHYAVLKAELKTLRGSTDDAIVFPEKVFLKPGATDEVVPLLMKALKEKMSGETGVKHAETIAAYDGISTVYDQPIVDLVRDVQRDLGLKPDGVVGPMTISRLGGESLQSKIDRVEMAMERLRWHPEKYGHRQVVINQPEYKVRYMVDGKTDLKMNVVVGTKANQTYFFHDEIETVVFNPYWGVPQSIIVNEMLPRLRRDPGYLDRAGYVVTTAGGKQVSSSAVNWGAYSGPVPYNVRQKPGPKNSLGELKILFPNKHAIYMHDTPAKNLFSRETRAYSHGCVRLEDPRAMAAAVLGKSRDYVAAQLAKSSSERGEQTSEKIPVYVGYFTAWPDDDGAVKFFPDVYDRDSHLEKAMNAVHAARASAS